MRITALVHFSMPWRNAGSETVLHELLKAAASEGHDVAAYVTDCGNGPPTVLDGVTIFRCMNLFQAGTLAARSKPDVIVSHHQHVMHAVRTAKLIPDCRSVYLVHNHFDLNQRPLQMAPDLVIYNSHWVRADLTKWHQPSSETMTMHPPLTIDRHLVDTTGDAITLVNLNADKGAELFYRLAEANPDRKFLGVVGAHGRQIVRRDVPNIEIMEHGPDMKRVWAKTRILLMPSIAESYGLVAIEAGLNRIPTIAAPTPGLMENLGEGGLFIDRDDAGAWSAALVDMDEPSAYGLRQRYASHRAGVAVAETGVALAEWLDWVGEVG